MVLPKSNGRSSFLETKGSQLKVIVFKIDKSFSLVFLVNTPSHSEMTTDGSSLSYLRRTDYLLTKPLWFVSFILLMHCVTNYVPRTDMTWLYIDYCLQVRFRYWQSENLISDHSRFTAYIQTWSQPSLSKNLETPKEILYQGGVRERTVRLNLGTLPRSWWNRSNFVNLMNTC